MVKKDFEQGVVQGIDTVIRESMKGGIANEKWGIGVINDRGSCQII